MIIQSTLEISLDKSPYFRKIIGLAVTALMSGSLLILTAGQAHAANQVKYPGTPTTHSSGMVFGYYTNWDIYARNYQATAENIPFLDLSAVIYAFAEVGNCALPYSLTDPTVCNAGSYATGVQDYKLYSTDPWSDFNKVPPGYQLAGSSAKGTMSKIINQAHAHDKPALLSIGGYSLSAPLLTAMRADKRSAFINSIMQFLQTVKNDNNKYPNFAGGGFDGIDIDWEPNGNDWTQLKPEDIQAFADFLQQLRAALKQDSPTSWLTIAMPAAPASVDALAAQPAALKEIIGNVDFIDAMTYDYHGAFDQPLVSNFLQPINYDEAQPGNVEHRTDFNLAATLQAYQRAGVPPAQMLLGAPTYGRAVQGVAATAPIQYPWAAGLYQPFSNVMLPGEYGDNTGTYDYKYIVENMEGNGGFKQYTVNNSRAVTLNSDTTMIGTAAYNPNYLNYGGTFISFVDEKNVATVADLVNNNKLAGIMVWALDGDFPANDPNYNTKSLIHAAKANLR